MDNVQNCDSCIVTLSQSYRFFFIITTQKCFFYDCFHMLYPISNYLYLHEVNENGRQLWTAICIYNCVRGKKYFLAKD
jgi:hypothetical protein